MRKIKDIFMILFCSSMLLFNACDEGEDIKIVLDTVADGMQLTPSSEEIVLLQERMDEPAITFQWSPAQERSNNGTITYYFKLGLPGFSKSIDKIQIEPGTFEYSLSHYDLNILAYGKLGVSYGSTAQLEAEIIASSDGDFFVKPEISSVKFTVTTFEIAPVNLYLVGTANPKGSELDKGIKLTEIVEGRDIGNSYQWEGNLQAGTFKFVNSLAEDKGSWSMGANSTELVQNVSSGSSDVEFTVTKPGLYSIILNKTDREIIYGYKGFSHIWGVGSGIGVPWSMPSSAEFSWDARNPGIFTLECNTQANQDFKLPYDSQSNGWGSPFLRPYEANANIWLDSRMQATPSGYNPDLKWLITEEQAGHCLLTIDALNETITLVKID
ncbi:MAG: SusF/SusE family outer membrane protein [Bacteroidales bacterium]|nr:SusF/SusE family outer membrane protein [Bacteroidales bacterium]